MVSIGSMYEANYYKNPMPYYGQKFGEPIPWWGVLPSAAGPATLAVNGLGLAPGMKLVAYDPAKRYIAPTSQQEGGAERSFIDTIPWWGFPLGAAALVGAGLAIKHRERIAAALGIGK